jgi:2-methylcitrate dehydratase PrpD
MPQTHPDATKNWVLQSALEFALERKPDAIPQQTLNASAMLLLDTLGVCIAAQPMEAGTIARTAALRLYGTSQPDDQAPMMFDGRIASRAGAAFATATQIDNLDAHDGYNPTKGHIGVAAVPTLVAMAHGQDDLSGRDALAALVVGYEIAGRAGIALHESVSDYHTSGAWNGLGVAAIAARLNGMSADQLRHAWGIAEYHGPRSQMMREIANPTMLHDGSGMGTLVGISAAVMAQMGFTGAPALTVESDECSRHWADLGQFWQMEHQYVKPYPICRWAHAAIDAVRELRIEKGFAPDQITAIEVHSFHNAARLFPTVPDTTSQAQYSMAFAVAIMAAYGEITLDHISGTGLRDTLVAGLVNKTRTVETEQHEARFPGGRWADVVVTLTDGTRLESGDTHARGGPERPMSLDEVCAKFMALATPVIGDLRAELIRDAALSLTEADVPFTALTQHLIKAP